MKLEQDDPRLTSYVLGELPSDETAKLEYAIAADPALRLAIGEIERSQSEFSEMLGGSSDTLLPRQRGAIMRAAKEAARKGKVGRLKSHRKAPTGWFLPIAAAAVVGGGIFVMTLISPQDAETGKKTVSANANEHFELPTGADTAGGDTIVQLPLTAGKRSLSVISQAVREKGEMPAKDDVRIEELLNGFPLRTKGSVALWKGCSLGVEIIQCPWKPSASLVCVDVRGAKNEALELSVEYRTNKNTVIDQRILGYRASPGKNVSQTSRNMEPGAEHFIAILVNASGDDLGSIEWTVGGESAPAVLLERDLEKEPSTDASFAALVCGYGLWLRGEEAIDDAMLLGLAREVAAESMVADRYDFLELVDQSVKLAGE